MVVRRDAIGFIFQLFYLIPTLTAVENVELPLLFAREKQRRERALAALARVGMTEPHALPAQLDGGGLQRVAIARALVRAPRILLADEPTGRLPPHERDEILDIFYRLQRDGLAIILVTHDPALAQRTERVIALADGKTGAERSNITGWGEAQQAVLIGIIPHPGCLTRSPRT